MNNGTDWFKAALIPDNLSPLGYLPNWWAVSIAILWVLKGGGGRSYITPISLHCPPYYSYVCWILNFQSSFFVLLKVCLMFQMSPACNLFAKHYIHHSFPTSQFYFTENSMDKASLSNSLTTHVPLLAFFGFIHKAHKNMVSKELFSVNQFSISYAF